MPPAPSPRSGFSLIELLVVVSIIAVLAGMLLPAVGLVRDSARGVQCAGNLRQLQLANIAYAGENEGRYIPSFYVISGSNWKNMWILNMGLFELWSEGVATAGVNPAGVVDGYDTWWTVTRNLPSRLLCPLARPDTVSNYPLLLTAYGYNSTVPYHGSDAAVWKGPAPSLAGLPNKVSFLDGMDWNLNPARANANPQAEGVFLQGAANYRHRGSANAAFFDGHVASMRLSELYNPTIWY